MKHRLAHIAGKPRALVAAFVIAGAVCLFFAVRLVVSGVYWSDPAHRDQTISGWMTPRYIAMSWDVPPEVMRAALELDASEGGRLTLEQLAASRGMTVDALAAKLDAAIVGHREGK